MACVKLAQCLSGTKSEQELRAKLEGPLEAALKSALQDGIESGGIVAYVAQKLAQSSAKLPTPATPPAAARTAAPISHKWRKARSDLKLASLCSASMHSPFHQAIVVRK